jgi:hypothetical protein
MKKIKLWLIRFPALATALFFGARGFVLVAAADTPTTGASGNVGFTGVTTAPLLADFICKFVNYFVWIVIIVSVIMILLAAFEYVTAQDDTEKTHKARWTITYGAIGLAVALLATVFPAIVASVFGGVAHTGTIPSCVVGF